jgi:hypothetical protein
VDLITFATRDYQWLLRPLAALYEKYVGGSVICYGDARTDEVPGCVEFRPVPGWDLREHFGAGFASIMNGLEDDIALISLADMWPSGPAHLGKVERLVEGMRGRRDSLMRILVGDNSHLIRNPGQRTEDWDGLRVATIPVTDIHIGFGGGLVLWPSLWNRELVLPLLEDTTIWEFEATHCRKLKQRPELWAAWVLESVYPYAHTLSRYNTNQALLGQLSAEDRELVKPLLPDRIEVVA